MAQETTKGRIYIGAAQDAPAWVWQIPRASADTNQMAVSASWVKWVESAWAHQRADVQKAMLKAEAGRAQLTRQRGIILDYNPNTLLGAISGEDGNRWPFRGAEWAGPRDAPERGLWVDFVPEAETGYALFV